MGMKVQVAKCRGKVLDRALCLADKNKKYLGFFPAEAFREQAQSGRVLVATASDDKVLGYLLFRVAYSRVAITHLCVDEEERNRGVARFLVSELRKRVEGCSCIEARCRKDFFAHSVYEKLGFSVKTEVKGRSKKGYPITVFQCNLGQPDLFSLPPKKPEAVRCVLDNCVLIGIQDDNPSCLPLVADWIEDHVELVVTPETRNEINKIGDTERKRRRSEFASGFMEVHVHPDEFERAYGIVKTILSKNNQPDIRQLSWAGAADVDAFITTDDGIIKKANEIFDKLGLKCLYPAEFIREYDSIHNARDYVPARLAGTSITINPLVPDDLDAVCQVMRVDGSREKKSTLKAQILRQFNNREKSDVYVIKGGNADLLGLVIGEMADGELYRILALRLSCTENGESLLMRALARHLVYFVLNKAIGRGCKVSVLVDRNFHQCYKEGLLAEGFSVSGKIFSKIHISGALSGPKVSDALLGLSAIHGGLVRGGGGDPHGFCGKLCDGDQGALAAAEDMCWPLKVKNANIDSYVIPIRPQWAEHLFDPGLASQGLFGADKLLGLSRCSVYYRKKQGLTYLASPARILWYVSGSSNYNSSKAIRACSLLIGCSVGPASWLYRKYRRYGVWQWQDVLECAGGDPEMPIVAIEFSRSECFPCPVAYSEAKSLIGYRGSFPSPLRIPANSFIDIYSKGMGL